MVVVLMYGGLSLKMKGLTTSGYPEYIDTSLFYRLYSFLLSRSIFLLIGCISIVAYIDGYLIERVGFMRFETIYYVLLLSILLIWILTHKISQLWLGYLLLLLAAIWIGVLLNGMDSGRLIEDTRYYLRSYLLGILVFLFFTTIKISQKELNFFFWIQWLIIVSAVVVHLLTGFGGTHTGRETLRNIYAGFFKEANVVSFFLVCVWYYLYVYLKGRYTLIRYVITAITLAVVTLMSSKASMVAIFFLFAYHWLNYFKVKSSFRRVSANMFIILCLFFSVIFFNQIIEAFLQLLIMVVPDSATIVSRLNTRDVITVLTSTRNLRLLEFFAEMKDYNLSKWLFGIGFKEILEKDKLIESDLFDIMQGFGLVGLIILYVPLILSYIYIIKDIRLRKADFRLWVFIMGIWHVNFFISTATGHVILTPMAVILLGLVFGYWQNTRLNFIKHHENPSD